LCHSVEGCDSGSAVQAAGPFLLAGPSRAKENVVVRRAWRIEQAAGYDPAAGGGQKRDRPAITPACAPALLHRGGSYA